MESGKRFTEEPVVGTAPRSEVVFVGDLSMLIAELTTTYDLG